MKKIGILGGMGPAATIELANHIIRETPAQKDQEHIPLIIHSNSQIPDRTRYIVHNEQSPIQEMKRSIDLLSQEADYIVIACNTAHYFYDEIAQYSTVPVLHIIHATAQHIISQYPNITAVGLLATDGTIHTNLYGKILKEYGIDVLIPEDKEQQEIMESIYGEQGIKAGHISKPQKTLQQIGQLLVDRGAQAVLAGCTEVPLALKQQGTNYHVIDTMKILARQAIAFALSQEANEEEVIRPHIHKNEVFV